MLRIGSSSIVSQTKCMDLKIVPKVVVVMYMYLLQLYVYPYTVNHYTP